MYGSQRLTYRELDRRANRIAQYLRSQGLGSEDRVGILMERSVDMIVSMLGIVKAGGAYVPLDPTYPVERLQFLIDDMEAPLCPDPPAGAGRTPDLGVAGVRGR